MLVEGGNGCVKSLPMFGQVYALSLAKERAFPKRVLYSQALYLFVDKFGIRGKVELDPTLNFSPECESRLQ